MSVKLFDLIPEGGECLIVVVVCGGQAGNHHGLSVPSKRILKKCLEKYTYVFFFFIF